MHLLATAASGIVLLDDFKVSQLHFDPSAAALIFLLSILLLYTLRSVWRMTRRVGQFPLLSTFLAYASILYFSHLLPGVFNLLSQAGIIATMVLLCLGLLALTREPSGQAATVRSPWLSKEWIAGPWTPFWIALGLIPLIGVQPMLLSILSLSSALFNTATPLGWDVTVYHLPFYIDYFRDGHFWRIDQSYKSLPFAYELIASFPSMVLAKKHWSMIITHAYSIVVLFVAFALLSKELARLLFQDRYVKPLLVVAYGMYIFSIFFSHLLVEEIGKNDLLNGACILSCLVYLCSAFSFQANPERSKSLELAVFFSALALGLAGSMRPTSLFYTPFYFYGLYLLATSKPSGKSQHSSFLRLALIGGLVLLATSGFFYLRNLVVLGSPMHSGESADSLRASLAYNLFNPSLYQLSQRSILFLLCTILPIIFLGFGYSRKAFSKQVLCLCLAFHVNGLLAFAFTPYGVFHLGPEQPRWVLRYGLAFFLFAFSITLSFALFFVDRLLTLFQTRVWRRVRFFVVAILSAAFMVVVCVYWDSSKNSMLPGYYEHEDRGGESIYTWVQSLPSAKRIVSYGVRPYTLAGAQWQHELRSRYSSMVLYDLEKAKKEIVEVVESFAPDILIFAANSETIHTQELAHVPPENRLGKPEELISWMKGQGCFVQAYSDSIANVFLVARPCAWEKK